MQEFVVDTLEHRPNIGASHAITLIQRALQAQAYGKIEGYPHDHTTPEAWLGLFDTVLNDPDMGGQVLTDVYTRDPQSLVIERYMLPKITIALARKMGRTGLTRLLDVGSSLNGGAAYLTSNVPVGPNKTLRDMGIGLGQQDLGLYAPDVIMPGPIRLNEDGRPQGDRILTQAVFSLLNEKFAMEYCLGMDKFSPKNSWDWAFANSFNPDELLRTPRVALFNWLVREEHENVGFIRMDFTKLDGEDREMEYDPSKDEFAKAHPEGWPVVNMSTMLYMATPSQRHLMLARAKHIASEIVIVSDFMKLSEDRSELEFLDDWNAGTYPYVTAIWDKRGNPPRWNPVIHSTDARITEMTIGDGRIMSSEGEPKTLWTPLGEFIVRNLEGKS